MSDQTNAVKVDIATINHFVNNSLLPSIIVMSNLFILNLNFNLISISISLPDQLLQSVQSGRTVIVSWHS